MASPKKSSKPCTKKKLGKKPASKKSEPPKVRKITEAHFRGSFVGLKTNGGTIWQRVYRNSCLPKIPTEGETRELGRVHSPLRSKLASIVRNRRRKRPKPLEHIICTKKGHILEY